MTNEHEKIIRDTFDFNKTHPGEVPPALIMDVEALLGEIDSLRKELNDLRRHLAQLED